MQADFCFFSSFSACVNAFKLKKKSQSAQDTAYTYVLTYPAAYNKMSVPLKAFWSPYLENPISYYFAIK